MTLFYLGLYGRCCGLITARNLRGAERKALREQGTSNVRIVRYATSEDVASIRAMGGLVPKGTLHNGDRKPGKISPRLAAKRPKNGHYTARGQEKQGQIQMLAGHLDRLVNPHHTNGEPQNFIRTASALIDIGWSYQHKGYR